MTLQFDRRRLLRGVFYGAPVVVGLPMLDCFLNGNGTAYARGAPLPTCFANWNWGLGLRPGGWEPKRPGSLNDQPLGPQLAALEPIKHKINIFSKMKIGLDGKANLPHHSGWVGMLTGTAPVGEETSLPTMDTLIADAIGAGRRFPQLIASCTGDARSSLSYRRGGVHQPSEISPLALYSRIFVNGFRDPNAAEFKPDPAILAQRSVLSFVKDQREAMVRDLGSADRARMDEYFTSLRQLERQVDIQVEKPAPLAGCVIPAKPEDLPVGTEIETTLRVHEAMGSLMAHALACDQTRIVNLTLSDPGSRLRMPGDPVTHHIYSHQEPVDQTLGYQKMVSYFATRSMEGFASFLKTLDSFKEGDGTMLDRMLVFANTDVGNANTHAVDNLPILTAGKANGAMKTGLHVESFGDTGARVSLTVMQALKVPVAKFGTDANETSRPITEVLA